VEYHTAERKKKLFRERWWMVQLFPSSAGQEVAPVTFMAWSVLWKNECTILITD